MSLTYNMISWCYYKFYLIARRYVAKLAIRADRPNWSDISGLSAFLVNKYINDSEWSGRLPFIMDPATEMKKDKIRIISYDNISLYTSSVGS
jgi:hypothetical protein